MGINQTLQRLLGVETAALFGLVAAVLLLSPERTAYFSLFELFGALLAGTITTFGLLEMKKLTEN